jgi:hypothetical protein
MTIARQVVPGRTQMISRRCTQRQMLLRPDPKVDAIYLYCLAEAVQRFGVTLFAFVAMSNHQHLIVRDNLANFPEFLAHFHKMVAKAMNALLGRSENFWATEQPNAVHLVEAEDRFRKLVYLLANPVADHLVEHASDWPGASSFSLQLSGRTKVVKRPRGFFRVAGNMPAEVELRIERLEGFESLSHAEWRMKILEAVREEENRARKSRRASGGSVLGRKAILRADRSATPKTIEPRGKLRPCLACIDKTRRLHELEALRVFRTERRAALLRFIAGERDVPFPYGTYRVRGVFVVRPPPPTPTPTRAAFALAA